MLLRVQVNQNLVRKGGSSNLKVFKSIKILNKPNSSKDSKFKSGNNTLVHLMESMKRMVEKITTQAIDVLDLEKSILEVQ